MIWPGMDALAQTLIERVANSLPEGILIALGAWLLLRLTPRHSSGTRFAVWMIALVVVLAVPFFAIFDSQRYFATLHSHSEFTIPSSWALVFLFAWTGVSAVALIRVAVGLLQIRNIRKSCTEIDLTTVDPQLRQVIERSNPRVRLLISDNLRVPAAIGFIEPVIVLPAWTLREFTSAELQPILIHELTHLRRHDGWTNLFQKIARALFFFHPAVWWIDARLSRERELACDDAVLSATGNARAYAESLISLLEKSCGRRGWTMAQAAVARAREASQRITRILSGRSTGAGVALPVLSLATALFLACGGIALCAPRLLVFGPNRPSSIADDVQPRPDSQIDFRGGAVVPAAFHPALKRPVLHNAVLLRPIASRNQSIQSAAPHKSQQLVTPIAASRRVTHAASQHPDRVCVVLVVDFSQQVNPEHPAQIQTLQLVQEGPSGFREDFVRILIPNGPWSGSISKI